MSFLDNSSKIISEIQENVSIHKLEYKGIKYWPMLRIYLIRNFINNKSNLALENKKNKFHKFKLIYKAIYFDIFYIFKDFKNNKFLYKKADLFFSNHSTCRYLSDNKQVDMFFGFILNEAKKQKISFFGEEFTANNIIKTPRNEPTKPINIRLILILIFTSVFGRFVTINHRAELEKINEILIKNSLQPFDIDIFTRSLFELYLNYKSYKKILKKVAPKQVMTVTYYSISGYALMAAANHLKIPTYDIQHGVQGSHHSAYMQLPMHNVEMWECLPKYFVNWTKEDANHINSWGAGKHKGLVFGVPWHHYYRKNKHLFIKNKSSQNLLSRFGNYEKIYLFSFQPHSYKNDFLKELKRVIDLNKNILWLLRLHPSMLDRINDYSNMFNYSNVDISNATQAPLMLLLENIDLHITDFSSVVIEAELFGKPSLISQRGSLWYPNQLSRKTATAIRCNENLEEAIDRSLKLNSSNINDIYISSTELLFKSTES